MFTADTLATQCVLVTGGGSGLGLDMARTFARHGATVVICGRKAETLARAAADARQQSLHLETYTCDVRDRDAVNRMFTDLQARGYTISSLVNNAAGNFLSATEDLSENAFRTVLEIVLHGTFNCTQEFGRRLISAGAGGTVLNIVTTYTECGSAFVVPSACAKAGVHALTTSLAAEWAAYGIRVNAIAPGPFPTTGAWERLIPNASMEEAFRRRVPMGRFGTPSELSDLALFLLSDHSSFINGACIPIDGGERLIAGQFNFLLEQGSRENLKSMFARMKPRKSGQRS